MIYTFRELLSELGIKLPTLYYWLRTVDIPKRYDENRHRYFTKEDLDKLKQAREK